MKRPFLMLMFGFFVLPLLAQTYSYEFEYDASGNRTSRTVITIPSKAPDSLANEEGNQKEEALPNVLKEELFNGRSIVIYPNPTTGELILEITPFETGTTGTITLYTASGSVLVIDKQLSEINRLYLEELTPGNYLLRIDLDNQSRTYKIIKQ